jgi:hypothetical protein
MGQVFQMEFAGVVTRLEPIRYPSKRKVRQLPMHLEMLTKAGIRLMENVYMDEIAKQKVYEFSLFAAS